VENTTQAKKKKSRKPRKKRVMSSDEDTTDDEGITESSLKHAPASLDSEILDCIEVAW
jgi:hypothetical protein